ncbi:hypothetical protein [Rhodococcus koreensis]
MSSRTAPTREQLARWQKRDCARCGRHAFVAAWWPDGQVCRSCCDRALRIRGRCPGCGVDRALPGIRSVGERQSVCADCAGFTVSYHCARCGHEGKLHAARLCSRCTFSDHLTKLLDDGTGQIRPALVPLVEHLLAMDKPLSGLTWLYPRKGQDRAPSDLLRELGRGDIELTHEAFHALQPWRAAAHLQELLMACGVLPAVDKQICSMERWLITHFAAIPNPEHAQLVRRFVTWEVMPRLRTRAERKPLTPAIRRHASDQVKQATLFLEWLDDRGLTLSTCGQAAIDTWYVEHNHHARTGLRPFLLWCISGKLTSRFRLPSAVIRPATPLPQHDRIALLGRLLTDDDQPLRSRAAAVIVLLYAQPLTRVVRLTVDDVIQDGDQILLRLGQPPSPVPGPAADILLRWIDQRTNMNTATNRNSRWLFPGRRAGQPIHPETLGAQVKALGVPTVPARVGAIHQHVLDMPAPVVADALGYHHVTTTKIATQVTATWNRYVAARSPSGWTPPTRDS